MKPLDAAARASRPEFDVHLTENVMVPMRNGVRMATDIYRPARAGQPLTDRRPVLLHRTPYPEAAPGAEPHPARSGRMTANCQPQAVAAGSKPSATARARGGSI
jgi:predicted acyl esterase